MKPLTVRRLWPVGTVAVIAANLAAAITLGQRPAATRPSVVSDPNDPEKTRVTVSPEERETLGLTPRTWTGVVQPQAYTTLDALSKTADRLKKTNTVQAIQALHSIRFEGTVYVQIQLKPDSRIQDAQHRVLASLKASEFHPLYLFEASAGLTGYATKEALDRLAKSPDVTGVCLDDKALPGPGKIVVKDALPPAKPGEAANEPGVPEKKVDPDVYRALALTDRVDVLISLREDSLPKLTDVPSQMHAQNQLRKQAEKQLQDRVLSLVSADEFWLSNRLGPGISGRITKEGIDKLWKDPDVRRIYLPQAFKVPDRTLRPR